VTIFTGKDIAAFQRAATVKAAQHDSAPLLIEKGDVTALKTYARGADPAPTECPIQFPNLGGHVARNWEPVLDAEGAQEYLFCQKEVYLFQADKHGATLSTLSQIPNGCALTQGELADKLKPGFGYGIIEEGQFQLCLGLFRHVR